MILFQHHNPFCVSRVRPVYRHHCEKLYGCCCCCCDHFSLYILLDLKLAEKNREIKTIGKIDRYKTTVDKDGCARGGISSFASYFAEHPPPSRMREMRERERFPLALVCCLVRCCVWCSASKSSIKWEEKKKKKKKMRDGQEPGGKARAYHRHINIDDKKIGGGQG